MSSTNAKEHKLSGIYQIKLSDDWFYIGSSKNIHKRFVDHRYELSKGVHTNEKMQRVYNKYNNIEIRILSVCPVEYLTKLEQWFLDNYKEGITLNIVKMAAGNYMPTSKESTKEKLSAIRKGRVFSDITRQRISESKMGSKNAMYGVKQSKETIEKRTQKIRGRKRSAEEKLRTLCTRKDRKEYLLMYKNKIHYCFNMTMVGEVLNISTRSITRHVSGLQGSYKKYILLEHSHRALTPELIELHSDKITNLRPTQELTDLIIQSMVSKDLVEELTVKYNKLIKP